MTDRKQTGLGRIGGEDKTRLVRGVFESVARRYDLMNDVMSLGVHRLWKRALVDWLNPQPGWTVLDVAGGTGDIAFRIVERVRERAGTPPRLTVVDPNARMLEVGRERAAPDIQARLSWLCAAAEALPVPDRVADAYTVAFGLRNVTDLDRALAEAYRVLKPGGRFLCLEFTAVATPGLDTLYDAYSFRVIPELGKWIAGDEESYRYLVESIRAFPDQETFSQRIAAAGLSQVKYRNLSGGIATLHSAWRI